MYGALSTHLSRYTCNFWFYHPKYASRLNASETLSSVLCDRTLHDHNVLAFPGIRAQGFMPFWASSLSGIEQWYTPSELP